jgi:cytochrome c553/plastocyanin
MRRLTEDSARYFLFALVGGVLLVVGAARWLDRRTVIEIHASIPDNGGWSSESLSVGVGETLRLRLVSDDVLHGFAIGQSDQPELVLKPGQPVETTLSFDRPGKYVYYCTRWCGLDHWRMRGTIDVVGSGQALVSDSEPLYLNLGLDIDAPHLSRVIPQRMPSPRRGAILDVDLPGGYSSKDYYQSHSPAEAWSNLRAEPVLTGLDDQQIWDLVAYIWSTHTSTAGLEEGERLYRANCAACHGENGAGDGVMADQLVQSTSVSQEAGAQESGSMEVHDLNAPVDFTNPENMLGASPALLQGKILRGGMGTGMPYWGPIFTEDQIWNIVSFLWTFQFEMEVKP